MQKFTTYGRVCGGCGHRHRSRQAAEQCAYRNQNDCQSAGGYSDRQVLSIDSERLPQWYADRLAGK